MTQDAERIRKLISFKENLGKKVEQLDEELKESQAMLEMVNSILLEKGFKRVEIPKESPPLGDLSQKESALAEDESEPSLLLTSAEPESVTLLKSVSGEPLASMCIMEGSLRVIPAQDKNFDVNTPPFTQFLVERVLMKMQERDTELARTGRIEPNKMLTYNIVRDGNIIQEISIRNVDAERLRELKSSIRWTFEKMNEKTKGQI